MKPDKDTERERAGASNIGRHTIGMSETQRGASRGTPSERERQTVWGERAREVQVDG